MELFSYIIGIFPQLMIGVFNTFKVYFGAIVPALLLGMLFGIIKASGGRVVRSALSIYTWAWRGTPLLLQLMIMKYGLPMIGINISDMFGAIWVFALNMAAYVTEIMRAAIQSVDKGQYEACRALCIPYWRMMVKVIIPQSIRIALPPACGEAINLIKDTALISIISMQDIVRVANQLTTRDKTIVPYVIAFIIYLALTSVLVKAFGLLEKKYTAYD